MTTALDRSFMMRHMPEHGESLSALIHALSILNGYNSETMVLRVWRDRMVERGVQDSISLPCREGSFAALSELTGLSPTTLHSITLHRYTQVVVSHVQPVESVLLNTESFTLLPKKHYSHHFRSDGAAAWCPKCIAEGRLHQLIWQSRFTMICLRHDCFLEDRYPACLWLQDTRIQCV